MAPAAEDVLGELYAWDSVIEDDSSLSIDDPQRDEDKTEDAFEQIIHTASGDASDIVLSLAAQLLHKHFFRFPHVQINVIDVLLKLCGSNRSQAVRIHTLRALLQIVKTPPATAAASTPTSAASIARKNTRMWLQHINDAVQYMLDTEKSSVILRQVTPLRQVLEERLQPEINEEINVGSKMTRQDNYEEDNSSNKKNSNNDKNNMEKNDEMLPLERNLKQPRDESDTAEEEEGYISSERALKKTKYDDEATSTYSDEGKVVEPNRESSSNGDTSAEVFKNPSSNGPLIENEGRRPKINAFSPRNCPPCPYLFLGSVPRHTTNSEIVEYLTPVWPSIDSMSVQLKQPDHNATAYAFVSMPSIEHAREAIHYVAANKFRGRAVLNANFARGPPVDTVHFVERTGEYVKMEDKGAVRDFDFSKCDPEVWDVLCQQLERFGPLSFAENGRVRFRCSEHAKAAIRKQLFTVKGYEIYPVYDTKEQFAIDSTRRGSKVHNKQGFTLKSGRLVGGDSNYRGSKKHHYEEDDDYTAGSNGRRERDGVISSTYSDFSRSPLRSDRESAHGQSRPYSPKPRSGGDRYIVPMGGFSKDRQLLHSRSRSPVALTKKPLLHEIGHNIPADKEICRSIRSKYDRRSPYLMDARSYESAAHVGVGPRGRPRERDSSWNNLRSTGEPRERREFREEGRGHGDFRSNSPSLSPPARRCRKGDHASQRPGEYRRGDGVIEGDRQIYRETLRGGRGRTHPAALSGGVLDLPRSRSRSPQRFGKYATGSSKSRPQSPLRSRSPQQDVRTGSSMSQRSSRYRDRDDRSIGNQLPDERQSSQVERPRFADDRSIAEVARDEQQERQRYFQQQQQQQQGHRDTNLSRYGAGRGGGRGGGRGDRYHVQQSHRVGRSGAMIRHDVSPPRDRSPSQLPPPAHHRSVSPPPRGRQHSSSPVSPPQQRELYTSDRRGEFALHGRESAYSPPPSPLLPSSYRSAGPSDHHDLDLEADDREPSRHERRHHSCHDRSQDDNAHRSHRERGEKRPSRPEPSMTPSPVRREHASVSSGRKSGHSPRRSFSRHPEGDDQGEEVFGNDKKSRLNENDSQPQEKEVNNEGVGVARNELYAGVDDLTVDYEEDDE
ncbi:unnamed protein product [Peronospora belbahrii]|uniref:RRM domain-containing protein n=1 Tax=Peronospora belbahrii TaxID=622444 RepID=A0AAU9L1C0_9STRA|nr:unnamed protein product [Peronospora belbahrii]CAH0522011.1 unnamed protein product [Peronospora belbahrii]